MACLGVGSPASFVCLSHSVKCVCTSQEEQRLLANSVPLPVCGGVCACPCVCVMCVCLCVCVVCVCPCVCVVCVCLCVGGKKAAEGGEQAYLAGPAL